MTTAERIRMRRKQIGMSADVLAEKIGVSRSTVFRYENGDIEKVPANNLVPIAKALNTTLEFLIGWEDDPDAKTPTPANGDGCEHEAMQYFDRLSDARKAEALNFLRYLAMSEDKK